MLRFTPVMVGGTIAHYQVLEKLGAGGMGEVYRARDTRLGREVAIKVLPPAFADDPERMARFEREAQVLASLNHPNIAQLYGLEERALVMEYVPGDTLHCPLREDEILPILRQIIDALEEAHERGIVHRDLKPANIKVTPEGKVKVLDFGLAKALADDPVATNASNSPTLAATALTRSAVLLGTAAYMSPEQARGKVVDKRSDIFAFGAVLYEMLTGRQAFGGETISDSLAAILAKEPDWTALSGSTSSQICDLVRRCLEKDPKRRLRDIGDARILLNEPNREPPPNTQHPSPTATWAVTALAVVSVVAVVALWGWLSAPKPAPRPVVRLSTPLPPSSTRVRNLTVSPDGTRIAFRGGRPDQIHLRASDQLEAKPVPGTENPFGVCFSPDGQWLAFSDPTKIKKVPVNGGAAITLGEGSMRDGASWGPDGDIVFAGPGTAGGLMRVSSAGGKPQPLTKPDSQKGETTHRWPQVLPGGNAVLFSAYGEGMQSWDDARIAVLDRKTGRQKVLVEGGTYGRYAPTGHLLYWRAASLFAVPFDAQRLQVTGQAVPVLEGVAGLSGIGYADFGFSETGMLAYAPGTAEGNNQRLLWVDRQGQAQPLPAPPRPYGAVQVSPEGLRVAVAIGQGDSGDIWVYDLKRETLTRVTFQPRSNFPAWTPDGKRISFRVIARGKASLAWVAADGSGGVETLSAIRDGAISTSWSPDGKLVAFEQRGTAGNFDLWVLPVNKGAPEGERRPRAWIETAFSKRGPQFSPDGRWVAYDSQESGQWQVLVQPAPRADGPPPAAGKWQVSTDGGYSPRWARNGRELFYRNGDRMMAVAVESGPAFRAGTPKMLFEGRYDFGYDAAPDGKRFLMVRPEQADTGPAQMHVVVDWFEELKRRAPVGKN